MLLYPKSTRKFLQFIKEKDGKRSDVRMADIPDLTEFNCFYIRNDNGSYLLSKHTGCGTGAADFHAMLKGMFELYKDAYQRAHPKEPTARGRAKTSILRTKESWEAHASRLKQIDELTLTTLFSVDGETVEEDERSTTVVGYETPGDRPAMLRSRTIIERFRQSPVREVIAWAKSRLRAEKPQRGSLRGNCLKRC